MNRRALLKGLGLLGGALSVEGCIGLRWRSRRPALAPVDVKADREIRTVVGLRPFRPSGFVVRAEKLGEKLVVHNYGHGGAGVTLSWGTGELAARLAHEAGPGPVAVLGAGAVGLATARLLQERGHDVTIHAKALPPGTTSNIAGAQWFPFMVFDRDRRTPAFMEQLLEAARLSHARFQLLVGERYGVRWLPNYFGQTEPFNENGFLGLNGPLRGMMPGLTVLDAEENPFSLPYARRFSTMMIEPNVYLPALLDDFRAAGGRIVIRELRSPEEVMTLAEPVVVNCTGLGAKALFGDDELTPIKGQLTVLLPQSEIDYAALASDLYMFPRRDGILLGGTHERGVSSLEVNAEAKQRVLAGHASLFAGWRG